MRITFKTYDKMMPLDEMRESKFQTNIHNKKQIEFLAKIMRTHGVQHPISISNLTNTICFGHGRKEAALLNGWKEYPVIFQNFASEAEEKVSVTSDNAIALWADLDLSKINQFVIDEGPDIEIDLWGLEEFVIEPSEKFGKELVPDSEQSIIVVDCKNEQRMQQLYEELIEREYECKIIT